MSDAGPTLGDFKALMVGVARMDAIEAEKTGRWELADELYKLADDVMRDAMVEAGVDLTDEQARYRFFREARGRMHG